MGERSNNKIIKNWWDKASHYYQDSFNIPTDDIYYGPFCPTEKELNILGVDYIKNKRVLELGCGGGQTSVFLSKNGAICKGIDISSKQIQHAIKISKENGVKVDYHIGSGEDLGLFKNKEFDIVLSIFAIQYINNLDKCFKEVNRVLKNSGKFIFSLDHPFYSVVSPKTMKVIYNYNDSGPNQTIKTSDIITKNKWRLGDNHKFLYYFRKVSDIYNSISKSSLILEEIKEPTSHNIKNPWNKIYSQKLSEYVAPTIIFIIKKP